MNMYLEIECKDASITSRINRLSISIDGVDIGTLLEDIGYKNVINEIGADTIIQTMGSKLAVEKIEEVDDVLDYIPLSQAIAFYGIDEILDEIGMAEAKAKWGLIEPE